MFKSSIYVLILLVYCCCNSIDKHVCLSVDDYYKFSNVSVSFGANLLIHRETQVASKRHIGDCLTNDKKL